MSFWGTEKFKENLSTIIPGGDKSRIEQGSYRLSLGDEIYIAGQDTKQSLSPGDLYMLRPGEIAILITLESVAIPENTFGLISLRCKVKLPGLINVSGFHADPGYNGKLYFTVYNAGTEAQPLQAGAPFFQLWLADMSGAPDPHTKPGATQIEGSWTQALSEKNVSPASLRTRIEKLESYRPLILSAIGAVLLVLFSLLVPSMLAGYQSLSEKIAERSSSIGYPGKTERAKVLTADICSMIFELTRSNKKQHDHAQSIESSNPVVTNNARDLADSISIIEANNSINGHIPMSELRLRTCLDLVRKYSSGDFVPTNSELENLHALSLALHVAMRSNENAE